MTASERYLLLGLRLGRHVDGLVDAYYGPPELKEKVDAEPLIEPPELVTEAVQLVDELEDGWLRDQALALRTYAGALAGEAISYSEEVEGCYGVRPTAPGEDEYRAAHEALDALLPGTGSLVDRREAWRASQFVPEDKLLAALPDVVAALRAQTLAVVDLPDGEDVVLETVKDEPWGAFNYYLGDLRSRVVINLDLPITSDDLISLAAHEVYPGHHTEHALKEQLLLREQGRLEEAIQLVPTPQAVLSEGIAVLGIEVVLDEKGRAELVAVLRRHGLTYDDERAEAIRAAVAPFRAISVSAALMIHEHGATTAEAEAYVQEWGLCPAERAAHIVRFVTDPTWRAYPITYSAGFRLCRAYVADDPARFHRLLTERVRVGELLAAAS